MKCLECNHTKFGDWPQLYDIHDNLKKCRVCDGVFDQNGKKVNPKEQSESQDPDFESSDNPGKHFAKFKCINCEGTHTYQEMKKDARNRNGVAEICLKCHARDMDNRRKYPDCFKTYKIAQLLDISPAKVKAVIELWNE